MTALVNTGGRTVEFDVDPYNGEISVHASDTDVRAFFPNTGDAMTYFLELVRSDVEATLSVAPWIEV